MNHHHHRLRRGLGRVYNAVTASISRTPPQKKKKQPCPRPYILGSVSSLAIGIDSDSESDLDTDHTGTKDKMGKSNKFDYTNRPNSGAKLGQIIAGNLDKEAEKVLKDADKQASKARKHSTGSTASGISSSDAVEAIVHPLDIKVPGKQLGDEGTCAMAAGLELALRKGTRDASILLEDLNLSDNGLTTVSLERLAPIIALAKHDLKTLNLADNAIKVETTEEAEQWETFLRSFKCCLKLRRLDLSGNHNLGARALEILARVHIGEEPINPMPATGETSVQTLVDDRLDCDNQKSPTMNGFEDSIANGQFIKRRCGLRSIPYLTLTGIGLNDAGALWLSYVLEDHHFPPQLIDGLNAALPGSTINTYQQSTNFRGVDWNERESGLSRDGLFLLKKTEAIRQQTLLADQMTIASSDFADQNHNNAGAGEAEADPRRSMDRRHSRASRGDRRASIRSIHTADGGEHELSELDSARKKIQRSIIAQHGAASVELWHAGMRVAIASRTILRLGPMPRNPAMYYTSPPLFDFTAATIAAKRKQSSRPVTPNSTNKRDQKCSADSGQASPVGIFKQGTYAATLTANTGAAPGEPELAITEVTNSPATPKMIFKPHRKGAFSDGSDLHAVAQKLDGLIVRDDNPQRFVRWQEERMPNIIDGPNAFRNSSVPSHLPTSVMRRIVLETVSRRGRDLLSDKQVHNAIAWGQKRSNFEVSRESRKLADSAQVWTLLESIGCLEYGRE